MDPIAKSVVPIRIQDEMRSSYMDYSMSVIIGRAIPDVRDGLKPVHRRIVYAMFREGLLASRKYTKCAGVVGEVLKHYHPHGDSAVYDALVRMAQPWNLRYLLVDGQGNFGSVDGDPAAAYRYTECRMTRLAEELLADIDKETVPFQPNFDGAVDEPEVLPAAFPNLLVNGSDGIAVGMATKIPPHNLGEVIGACCALIDDPEIGLDDLMRHVPAPDFPTAATIYGRAGVREAYETGRGRVVLRGRAEFEELEGGRRAIVIDEIPYQVNKARLIEQIAELVRDRKLEGISALRDESDRQGMRIVLELKRDAFGEVVLNHLYKHTALQSTFGVIMLAIVNNRPRVLSLREMLQHYVAHRRQVTLRRTRFDLRKAEERAHVLEGYLKALDHLDEVIALIRASGTPEQARDGLVATFDFTEIQAQAILELRLQRLTGMERLKIVREHEELQARIAELRAILASEARLMGVVKAELEQIRDQYADPRRTRIVEAEGELRMLDLVVEEDQVVTLTRLGYIKRCSPDEWRMQKRGGLGKRATTTRDEDFVTSLFIANTHSLLLVFTTDGKVFPLPVVEVPEVARDARGRPIVNLVQLPDDTRIAAVVSVRELRERAGLGDEQDEAGSESPGASEDLLLFATRQGLVKCTPLSAFRNLRQGGLIASGVAEGDELVVVRRVEATDLHVMLLTRRGKAIRFTLADVPCVGRTARGNRGIVLGRGDEVVDALLVPPGPTLSEEEAEAQERAAEAAGDDDVELGDGMEDRSDPMLLLATELGYGKRSPFEQYRVQNRYGKGILSMRLTPKTGGVVGGLEVRPEDQVMLVTDTGRVIRIGAEAIRGLNRVSQGVRLMRLERGERIVDLAKLAEVEGDDVLGAEAPGDVDDVGREPEQ